MKRQKAQKKRLKISTKKLDHYIGRLFDAFASILGLCHINQFEGQAAMALEQAAMQTDRHIKPDNHYPFNIIEDESLVVDWQPLLQGVLADLSCLKTSDIAAKIHVTLAQMPFIIAQKIGQSRLAFSGGCFQNAYLVDAIEKINQTYQYSLFRQQNIPPNDGGLALGQVFATVINHKA